MKSIREWFQKRKEPVLMGDSGLISTVSICYRCGQVYVNEGEVPNHLCVASDLRASYSFDTDGTATTSWRQYRDFTITHEDEK